jgi:hypothetical protein
MHARESEMQISGRHLRSQSSQLTIIWISPSSLQHPPQHLKDQLLANGKQNLVMKNLISQQISHQHQSTMPALAQIVVNL